MAVEERGSADSWLLTEVDSRCIIRICPRSCQSKYTITCMLCNTMPATGIGTTHLPHLNTASDPITSHIKPKPVSIHMYDGVLHEASPRHMAKNENPDGLSRR